jgi:hypothetical protein
MKTGHLPKRRKCDFIIGFLLMSAQPLNKKRRMDMMSLNQMRVVRMGIVLLAFSSGPAYAGGMEKPMMNKEMKSQDTMEKPMMNKEMKSQDTMEKPMMNKEMKSQDTMEKPMMNKEMKSQGSMEKPVMDKETK